MKNNEATVFVFIASIIIGILISMNISFDRVNKKVFLNAKQYTDAYNEKNKLVNDIDGLMEKYNDDSAKIAKYKYSGNEKEDVLDEIDKELEGNRILIGNQAVSGPGVDLVINDASKEFFTDEHAYEKALIHVEDMMLLVNDLKNAGAEAISINEQRITDRSQFYCDGAFINVNGVKIVAPFEIKAIGDKDNLKNYMEQNDKHLASMKNRSIRMALSQTDDMKIPAYNGTLSSDFIKNVK